MNRKKGRSLSFVCGAFAIATLGHFGKLALDAGILKEIRPHFAGQCRAIPGLPGAEDLEASPAAKVLFISSDQRPEHPGQETPDGAIFAMDLSQPGALPRKLVSRAELGFEFHPHGISVRDTTQGPRVWAINHRKDEDTIEIFDYSDGRLRHQDTLRDPLIMNANDLVAIDDRRFYVTMDHAGRSRLVNRLEDYSRFGRGSVAFFDGSRFDIKAAWIPYANGVTWDAANGKLYVASMLGRHLRVYAREPATNNLSLERKIDLDSCPDNLSLTASGEIWIGAHPKIFPFKAQSQDHSRHAPAQVLRVRGALSEHPSVEEAFLDDGKEISAASVAYNTENRLILGSVFDDRILDCRISPARNPKQAAGGAHER